MDISSEIRDRKANVPSWRIKRIEMGTGSTEEGVVLVEAEPAGFQGKEHAAERCPEIQDMFERG